MQIDQDRLKAENMNLIGAYREKSRKHQQTQELYDRLKRKEMTAATQSAAFDSVDEVLGNASSRQGFGNSAAIQHHYTAARPQANRDFEPYQLDHNGVERVHTHQRSGSAHSQDNGGSMPPPPVRRAPGMDTNTFDPGKKNSSCFRIDGRPLTGAQAILRHPTIVHNLDQPPSMLAIRVHRNIATQIALAIEATFTILPRSGNRSQV